MPAIRIKLFIYIDSLRIGGMHRQMLYLAKHLNKEIFEVVVCAQKLVGGLLVEFELTGCKLIDLGWRRRLDPETLIQLIKALKAENPDIVFISEPQQLLYYRVAKLFFHGKTVQIGSFRAMTFWNGHLKQIYKPIDKLFSKWLISSSSSVIVNSTAMAENYSKLFESSSFKLPQVIYNGCDFSFKINKSQLEIRKTLKLEEEDIFIIMVARLDPWKDFSTLFDAFKIVKSADNRAKLFIVGEGELRECLEQMILHSNMQESIILLGEKNDVYDYINAADISVLSTNGEGFSNSILESMALSVPVIATNVGGNSEVLGDLNESGILIPPKSPSNFADALLLLMNNEDKRKAMGESAKKRIHQLCSLKNYISLYEDLFVRSLR